jgi:hypothetical protein
VVSRFLDLYTRHYNSSKFSSGILEKGSLLPRLGPHEAAQPRATLAPTSSPNARGGPRRAAPARTWPRRGSPCVPRRFCRNALKLPSNTTMLLATVPTDCLQSIKPPEKLLFTTTRSLAVPACVGATTQAQDQSPEQLDNPLDASKRPTLTRKATHNNEQWLDEA